MTEESKIPDFAKNDPKFKSVLEAPDAYHSGIPISARCPRCGELLSVTGVEAVDTIWVACPNGCTTYREKYAHGTLAHGKDDDANLAS